MKSFFQQLRDRCHQCGNPVLVGLDPRVKSLPPSLRPKEETDLTAIAKAYRSFCTTVIDIVAPLVPAIKPQAAFFEQIGPVGVTLLVELIRYAQSKGLLVILDGKRNDIGSTATAYADGLIGRDSPWGADSLTVSPYLGEDGIEPFLKVATQRSAGIFVLVRTSNPGGAMLQELTMAGWTTAAAAQADRNRAQSGNAAEPTPIYAGNPASLVGRPVYERVGDWVNRLAESTRCEMRYSDAVGAVVGATCPEQLAELRKKMPATWFLVPGFGAQGGGAADVAAAFDDHGDGAVINNSRGILFAYQKPEYAAFGAERWERAVEAATRQMIDQLRTATPAGKLGL